MSNCSSSRFVGGDLLFIFNFSKKKEKAETLKALPTFNLKTIEGEPFTQQNLTHDQIKVIVYFSPGCHFCQAEAEELSKSYAKYRQIQWIWVASEPLGEIKEFANKYKLDKIPSIYWCHDEMAILYQKLGANSVPYFLVYDKNNQLIKRNSGAIKLEKLLRDIDEKK